MSVSLLSGPVGGHMAGSFSERAQPESAAGGILRHLALHLACSDTVEQPGEMGCATKIDICLVLFL